MVFTWSFNWLLSKTHGFGFIFIHLLLCFWFSLSVSGQVDPTVRVVTSYRDSLHHVVSSSGLARVSCHFVYPQGSSAIVPDLGGNSVELSRLDDFIREALRTDLFSISRIRLTGYCSVEGEYTVNSQLSRSRVEGFHNYLQATYPSLYRYPVNLAWVPEDWGSLSQLLRSSEIPHKEQALNIIRRTPQATRRKKALRELAGGAPYRQMEKTLFPLLRRVEITVEYDAHSVVHGSTDVALTPVDTLFCPDPLIYNVLEQRNRPEGYHETARVVRVSTTTPNETEVVFTTPSMKNEQGKLLISYLGGGSRRRSSSSAARLGAHRVAVKTNLLYWAGITPDATRTTFVANLALEYFLSSEWSVEVGGKYGNWNYNHGRKFQGISGYRLEPRYWFVFPQRETLTFFLGIYGRFGDFNERRTPFLSAETTEMGEETEETEAGNAYTGKYWDAGVSAGFHLRLYRGLGIEAGVRAGYVSAKPTVYHLHNGHNCYDYDTSYGKFRVTDLNLSLVYRF